MTSYRPFSWRSPHLKSRPSRFYISSLAKGLDWLVIALLSAFISLLPISVMSSSITILLLPCLIFHSALTRHWFSLFFYMLAGLWIELISAHTLGIHSTYMIIVLLLTLKKTHLGDRPFGYQWGACLLSLVIYMVLCAYTSDRTTLFLPSCLSICVTALLYPILCWIPPWSTLRTTTKGAP